MKQRMLKGLFLSIDLVLNTGVFNQTHSAAMGVLENLVYSQKSHGWGELCSKSLGVAAV